MAEPFKEVFNQTSISQMASALAEVHAGFDREDFLADALNGLAELELKERSFHLADCLYQHLPQAYEHALSIMLSTLSEPARVEDEPVAVEGPGLRGFITMPFTDYVLRYGIEQFEPSMAAMKEFTQRFSAEFAIRPFLERYEAETLAILEEWAEDDCAHVRRLVSEGTRPRLPWGMRLKAFVTAPEKCLPLLEKLKDDPTEYVRRSVANHLNDISKDHPDLVAEVCGRWLEARTTTRERMVRHALRSNIKAAHRASLQVLGYDSEHTAITGVQLHTAKLKLGGEIAFSARLENRGSSVVPFMLDFVVYHRKAKGSLAPKVFKWKRGTLQAGEKLTVTGKHAIRPITTRRYYAGEHQLAVQLNGVEVAVGAFDLLMEDEPA